MNRTLRAMAPHSSKRISELAATLPDVLDLTVGVPPFGPPRAFRRRLAELTGHDGEGTTAEDVYAPSRGVPELRQAVARSYGREYGLDLDPDRHVLITNGAVGALSVAILTVTEPGDEVLVADPSYMIYVPLIRLLGRTPRLIPTDAAGGFLPGLDQVRSCCGGRARAILINSPANPTGAVYGAEQLTELCHFARGRSLRVIHDEVLDCFTDTGRHTPAIAVDGDAICANSLSKRFGMTGWRLGWLVADAEVVEQATKAHTFLNLAVGHAVQTAVAGVLADDGIDAEVRGHARDIRERGVHFLRELRRAPGLEVTGGSAGGFYAFVDVRGYVAAHGLRPTPEESLSEHVAQHLLDHFKIAVVPGRAFGVGGEGYVRMSFARSEAVLAEALKRLTAGRLQREVVDT